MPIPNPEHFFAQAERLLAPATGGAARQVDLRRAISAAFYGLFHAVLTAAADHFVGAGKRHTTQYALVYRSVDHRWLRELAAELNKDTPGKRLRLYLPQAGFAPPFALFLPARFELQERRTAAEYDPLFRATRSDALQVVSSARTALQRFQSAEPAEREAFLALVLFRPR